MEDDAEGAKQSVSGCRTWAGVMSILVAVVIVLSFVLVWIIHKDGSPPPLQSDEIREIATTSVQLASCIPDVVAFPEAELVVPATIACGANLTVIVSQVWHPLCKRFGACSTYGTVADARPGVWSVPPGYEAQRERYLATRDEVRAGERIIGCATKFVRVLPVGLVGVSEVTFEFSSSARAEVGLKAIARARDQAGMVPMSVGSAGEESLGYTLKWTPRASGMNTFVVLVRRGNIVAQVVAHALFEQRFVYQEIADLHFIIQAIDGRLRQVA